MKLLVDALNQEKALVGAFSMILLLQYSRRFVSSSTPDGVSIADNLVISTVKGCCNIPTMDPPPPPPWLHKKCDC